MADRSNKSAQSLIVAEGKRFDFAGGGALEMPSIQREHPQHRHRIPNATIETFFYERPLTVGWR